MLKKNSDVEKEVTEGWRKQHNELHDLYSKTYYFLAIPI
jgi:hypothetical protein